MQTGLTAGEVRSGEVIFEENSVRRPYAGA